MKIIAISDCLIDYHSFWIRIGQYLRTISSEYKVLITEEINSIRLLEKGDILILYRHRKDWGDIYSDLVELKELGVKIVSDVDDYLWIDGEKRGWDKDRQRFYYRALKVCDVITCSTGALKSQLEIMFKKQEISLIRNTAPIWQDKYKSNNSKLLRVGWTGAPWTRPKDLQLIQPIIEVILNNKNSMKLVHIGHSDLFPSMGSQLGIPEDEIEKHELCSHRDYYKKLDFDIGLAPLSKNIFNDYKSGIKIIEYSSRRIPWIASDENAYRELCDYWQWDGRLCKDESDWIRNFWELTNKELRIKEAIKLEEICGRKSGHSNGVSMWMEIIKNRK